ncbi:SURF1 family cytochrome oxidase biogenesis protein [Allosalinactinospora lopnorensis]|uniref:SURF1 family cytochrome oxidase biogenesis protein n=1 Tax=Allosalinactinospora lopnorensis TaxID=1352348 RepID=UPI000623DB9F|nr:SURF1 family protein [Allosalinactinospora lopnorensis]
MLAFHALVALIVPTFIALGFWQLGRWEDRAAAADLQEANINADPVPLQELSEVGEDVDHADRWRPVTATGSYDTGNELLVRNRDGSAGVGLFVLTPLVTDDGAAVLVNRGWVGQPPTATSQPDVPPPPEGEVTVTGRIQFSETEENTGIRDRGGLPEGQIMLIEVEEIGEGLPYPLYGGFVELTDQEPPSDPAPEPVAAPEPNLGMNLSYAVQWWVFTAIAIGGWIFLVRRELHDARDGGRPPGEGPGAAPLKDGPTSPAPAPPPRAQV